jgi:hypothetical protein
MQLISAYEAKGWRFSHLENVTTVRNNGCLAGLFGSATSTLYVQVAIFDAVATNPPPK